MDDLALSGEVSPDRAVRAGHAGRMGSGIGVLASCLIVLGCALTLVPSLRVVVIGAILIWALLLLFGLSGQLLFVAFGIFLALQQLLLIHVGSVAPGIQGVAQIADEVIIALLAMFGMLRAMLRGEIRGSWYVPGLLMALVSLGLVSSAVNAVPPKVVAFDCFLMIKVFVLFWAVAQLDFSEHWARLWWKTFTTFGILMLVLGLVDVLTFPWFRDLIGNRSIDDVRWGFVSAQALFTHPGAFGFFMSVLALVNLGLYSTDRRGQYLVLVCLFAVGVILSGRLKPIVALPIAGVFVALFSRRLSIVHVTAGALPILAFLLLFGEDLVEMARGKLGLTDPTAQLTEAAPRAVLYLTSFRIARDEFPLGAGFGRFGGEISRRYYSPVYGQYGLDDVRGFRGLENSEDASYYQDAGWSYYLGELGVLGIPIVVGLLAFLVHQMLAIARSSRSKLVAGLALGAAMVLVEASLEAVASPVLQSSVQGYFALGVAGVVYSAWLLESRRGWRDPSNGSVPEGVRVSP